MYTLEKTALIKIANEVWWTRVIHLRAGVIKHVSANMSEAG